MMSVRRAALVTGGGRGIGRSIGERLAREGFAVGLLARTVDEVEAAAAAIRDDDGEASGFAADVLDPAGLDRAVARFLDWSGGQLDALVCAAGRLRGIGPIGLADPDAWWLDVETALRGSQRAIRAALPALRRSPAASISLLVGPGYNGELAHAAGYGAAQAGLVRLAESLAVELNQDQIRVYAVYPGLVPTALMAHVLDSRDGRRWLPRFTEGFAEGKEVGPEVAAEMVTWLTERRPAELNGRVVPALQAPEVLELRLARIEADDLGRLRLR